jgi:hypothetical protein
MTAGRPKLDLRDETKVQKETGEERGHPKSFAITV